MFKYLIYATTLLLINNLSSDTFPTRQNSEAILSYMNEIYNIDAVLLAKLRDSDPHVGFTLQRILEKPTSLLRCKVFDITRYHYQEGGYLYYDILTALEDKYPGFDGYSYFNVYLNNEARNYVILEYWYRNIPGFRVQIFYNMMRFNCIGVQDILHDYVDKITWKIQDLYNTYFTKPDPMSYPDGE